jgi:hypothetical protein
MTEASIKSLASGGDTTARHEEHLELHRQYELRLAETRMCYPSSASRPESVCMKLVEAESGIGYEVLAHATSIRRLILKAADERGIEPRVRARLNRSHTVAELRAICLARAEFERPEDKGFQAGIKAWFLGLGKQRGLAFDAATALSEGSSANQAKPIEVAQFAAHCLAEARQGLGAPGAFNLRLKFECGLCGISPGFVAHVLGLKVRLVERWAMGLRRPTSKHEGDIGRLEAYLGLETGTLWSLTSRKRVRAGHVSAEDLPAEWRATRQKKDKLKKFLPRDFSSRPDEEKPRLVAEALAKMDARANTPRGKIARQRSDRYAVKEAEFSPALTREFEELRQNRIPKILPFGDLDQHLGWNEASFGKWKQRFCGYLGFLHRRLPELVHVPGYGAPDGTYVNIPIEDLTLAFAIVPDLVRAYECWLNWRKGSFNRDEKPTKDDIEFVSELERLTRPRKKGSFADRLRAGPNPLRTTT